MECVICLLLPAALSLGEFLVYFQGLYMYFEIAANNDKGGYGTLKQVEGGLCNLFVNRKFTPPPFHINNDRSLKYQYHMYYYLHGSNQDFIASLRDDIKITGKLAILSR